MRIDIMTDIETLGTNKDSTIFQIAAIAFDIRTGEHIAEFNQIADISKNESPINVTGDTLKWWLKTNKELFSELLNSGDRNSELILRNFCSWIKRLENDCDAHKEIHLWGNGILFDNAMLQEQIKALGLDYPIHYKNDRDVRTILDLASAKLGISEQEIKDKYKDENEVEHDAFDDVKFQIRYVVGCYNTLIGKDEKEENQKSKIKVGICVIAKNDYDRRKYFNLFLFMLVSDTVMKNIFGRDYAFLETSNFKIQFFTGKTQITRGHKFHYIFDLTNELDQNLIPTDCFEMIPHLSYYEELKELFKGLCLI